MKKILLLFILALFFANIVNAQFTRKVLFEEGTNASCAPCAANNPILKAFLDANQNTCLAIKYHASWPGFDPMYQANPTQNTERIVNYYHMNNTGVPYCNADGVIQDIWPFSNANFTNAMNQRLAIPAPLQITVVDQRIAGDSIKSTITINLPSNLPAGDYKLRVMAIEKWVIYTVPPGSNGETHFEHVFRRAYPGTDGVVFPVTAGNYQYIYTYKRETGWQDSSIKTVVFVQNDVNKEVMNVASSSSINGINPVSSEIPNAFYLSQNYPNPFNPSTNIEFKLPKDEFVTLKVYDMLGKEIAVLVIGNFKKGTYSVDWDASNLGGGVYFYTIKMGEFSETKKMILIK